ATNSQACRRTGSAFSCATAAAECSRAGRLGYATSTTRLGGRGTTACWHKADIPRSLFVCFWGQTGHSRLYGKALPNLPSESVTKTTPGLAFLSELHALGIDLFLHQQGLDTTTPAGKAMFQIRSGRVWAFGFAGLGS